MPDIKVKRVHLIPGLNGLRAISIIFVLLAHWTNTGNMPEQLKTVLRLLIDGSVGVRMFFEISGFLISYLLLKEYHQYGRINFGQFYLRRFLRLFPVFYSYLLVILLLKLSGVITIDAWNIVCALLYVENFKFMKVNWLVGHSWSLAVEEQFYLIWPAVFKYVQQVSFRYVIIVLALGSFMRSFYYKYTDISRFFLAPFLMHADFLLIGCILGILYFQKSKLLNLAASLKAGHLLVTVLLIWFFTLMEYHPVWDKLFIPTSGTVVAAGVATVLVYTIQTQGRLTAALDRSWVDFTGRLSYSLYVWQQLFLGGTRLFIPRFQWLTEYPQNMVFVWVATLLSYLFIERPFLRLKEHLSGRGSNVSETEVIIVPSDQVQV